MSIIDDTIFDGGGSSVPQANLNQSYSEANLGENPAVNLAIGRLSYAFDDLSTGYGNFAVEVNHVYNSISNPLFANKIVGVGNGWKLNLHQCLVQSGNDVVVSSKAYDYDNFGNLTLVQVKDCNDVVVSSKTYDYDNFGNHTLTKAKLQRKQSARQRVCTFVSVVGKTKNAFSAERAFLFFD